MESITLPYCWICERRFVDSVPPGPCLREEHHIIPRKAGGTDGPLVSLCDSHHAKLHKIANRLSSKKPYFDLLAGESSEHTKKLLWLATRVFNAFELVKGDPNKTTSVLLTLDRELQSKLDYLKKIYPDLRSREAIVNFAIDTLYNKHCSQE
jgi:hypothetical protein